MLTMILFRYIQVVLTVTTIIGSNILYVQSWSWIRYPSSSSRLVSSTSFVTTTTIPTIRRSTATRRHNKNDLQSYYRHNFLNHWIVASSLSKCSSLSLLSATKDIDSQRDDDDMKSGGDDVLLNINIKKPDILKPYLPATDINYINNGPIGIKDFIVQRIGEPTLIELSNKNILKIVLIQCNDLEVNTLVWKCLGYRFDNNKQCWNNEKVFPNWKDKFVIPPDFIGMQRIYTPEVDKVSLRANQALVKSIPMEYKQMLKLHLKPYGFKGYQYSELTPNKTRRAHCANWLLYYREQLFGYTIEELRERKQLRLQQQQQQQQQKQLENQKALSDDNNEDNNKATPWTLPVKEMF